MAATKKDQDVTKIQVEALIPQVDESVPEITRDPSPPNEYKERQLEDLAKATEAASLASANMDPAIAEVIASMQGEISRLNKEVQETKVRQGKGGVEEGPGGFPWQYYKRPTIVDTRHPSYAASGWVVVAPGGSAAGGKRDVGSYAFYTTKGFKPLMNYGIVDVPTGQAPPGDEYRTIIQNGGVHEFPVSQILALKWHLEPPVKETVFPQYEAVKDQVLSFLCDECEFELFFLPEDETAPQGVFRHLRNGHEYTRAEATMALRAQGITNVAPYAIRAATSERAAAQEAEVMKTGLDNYPDVKKAVDPEASPVVD